jgi:D-amino-acid oxidase
MSANDPDVLVIGAGVIGLTTAVCLAEAGARVAVHAAEPPARTTSAVAGAIWGPHLVGRDDRVRRWGLETRDRLYELAEAGPQETGVRLLGGRMVSGHETTGDEMVADLADVRPCGAADLPGGFLSGWRYTAPVVAMPVYLEYLTGRLGRAGGTLGTGLSYASLAQAAGRTAARVIVNCTGTGAHGFAGDPGVVPVRGQAVLAANPGLTEFFIGTDRADGPGGPDGTGLIYVFPRGGSVVLGGSHHTGDWNQDPDPDLAARIVDGCASIVPALRGAEVIAHLVGLRPTRPQVRLEAGDLDGGRTLVHNYGHGGAGVTLSWGCAADAAALALAALA